MNEFDIAILAIRLCVGLTLLAHGWNHAFGGGKIAGTARWFEGLGLRPGIAHAWASVVMEAAAAGGLILGLLTPLACAAAIGSMTVALIVAHRRNGFFVFRDGYEYVLMISVVCAAVAVAGPGRFSLDQALDLDLDGVLGFVLSAVLGVLGAALMLAVAWRPEPASAEPAKVASE